MKNQSSPYFSLLLLIFSPSSTEKLLLFGEKSERKKKSGQRDGLRVKKEPSPYYNGKESTCYKKKKNFKKVKKLIAENPRLI